MLSHIIIPFRQKRKWQTSILCVWYAAGLSGRVSLRDDRSWAFHRILPRVVVLTFPCWPFFSGEILTDFFFNLLNIDIYYKFINNLHPLVFKIDGSDCQSHGILDVAKTQEFMHFNKMNELAFRNKLTKIKWLDNNIYQSNLPSPFTIYPIF